MVSFFYVGIKPGIHRELKDLNSIDLLKLDINIDGFCIHKSVKKSFWPILGSINNTNDYTFANCSPFIIAVFYGKEKPPLNEFHAECIEELQSLFVDGYNGVKFCLRSIIADEPAKSFLKQCKGSSGYYGCCFYTVKGIYNAAAKRISFTKLSAQKRTEDSFQSKQQAEHHIGVTPLEALPIDMVSTFPIDYMHGTLIGVTKKLVSLWQKEQLDERVAVARKFLPVEFTRKCRSFSDLSEFKATEFRIILIYT